MAIHGVVAPTQGVSLTIAGELSIPGSGSLVYTTPFLVEDGDAFSLFMKLSGATPSVKIVRCYNPSLTTLDSVPEEGMWAELDLTGDEDVLTADFQATTWRIASEVPSYSIWMRYKITGNDENGEDTKLSMTMIKKQVR